MPVTRQEVTSSQTVDVAVALDADGEEVKIGDSVTATYVVTGIRCIPDPETGAHGKDVLEVGMKKPNGYVVHCGAMDSTLVRKAKA